MSAIDGNDQAATSDSDEYEDFLKSMKTTKTLSQYRLSNGNLSDFIVSSEGESCDSLSMGIHSLQNKQNADKTFYPLQEKSLNKFCNDDVTENKEDLKGALQTEKSYPKHKISAFGQTHKKKSVATPVKRVVFSSDSENDENVFGPPCKAFTSTDNESLKRKLAMPALNFSDSDQEPDLNVPAAIPILNMSGNDDSESEFLSLQDRVAKSQTVPYSLNTQKAKQGNTGLGENNLPVASTGNDFSFADSNATINGISKLSYPKITSSDRTNSKANVFTDWRTPVGRRIPSRLAVTDQVRRKRIECTLGSCFLSSLDDPVSANSGKVFKNKREELTKKLVHLYNESVFQNKLPGNLAVTWAKRLTKTAGVTKCSKVTVTETDDSGKVVVSKRYTAAISLSEKVIDCASRLRDTLIHEMCHAAVWLINNANESHGPFWRFWAKRATTVHPELPSIERCHNYDISFKYIYRCTRSVLLGVNVYAVVAWQ